MAIGFTLFFSALLGIAFVVLALVEKRTYLLQVIYSLVAAILTFVLGLTFANLGFERPVLKSGTSMIVERVIQSGVEIEPATRWATRGFGGWLVVLAAGEILRHVLKRSESTQLLGPTILFLAGALLVEPNWGLGVAVGAALVCATSLAIWGRREATANAKTVIPSERGETLPSS